MITPTNTMYNYTAFNTIMFFHSFQDIRPSPDLQYWRQGLYAFYSEHAFVLIESYEGIGVTISVPPSRNGTRSVNRISNSVF